MVVLQNLTYHHPDKELLFSNLSLTVNQGEKIGLTGNNGSGKSTLLRILAQEISASAGTISLSAPPYYIPQLSGQYNELTIAEVLQIDKKLQALNDILNGNVTETNMAVLHDDWEIEERSRAALSEWGLEIISLSQKMGTLSGGQKTKVFLAGITIHQPRLILMDEPSNHLDSASRAQLYEWIQKANATFIIISHDRALLNILSAICELDGGKISIYGGNYDFYAAQKQTALNAIGHSIASKEKELRKAREKERATIERQQKLDARGKAKQEKSGVARIMMNTLRNNAEKSTSKTKEMHAGKIEHLSIELQEKRDTLPDLQKMKLRFDPSSLHQGKILFEAYDVNFSYGSIPVWKNNMNIQIISGERILLKGANGSGKTTLIKLVLGELEPSTGRIYTAIQNAVYIDQDYSLLNNRLSVYEQAQQFNTSSLQEHEIKIRLTRFLFTKNDWNKPCAALSGGERMRLILCCLTIKEQAPDIIILDEPTNNIDIQSVEILTSAVTDYRGTLILVSHDLVFTEQLCCNRIIEMR